MLASAAFPAQDTSQSLQRLYQDTMSQYRAFFQKVREAFNAHCDQIKSETESGLAALGPDDKEGRKKVLSEQKRQLDEGLSELKKLLNYESRRMRQALEEIRRQQEAQQFDLDQELASM